MIRSLLTAGLLWPGTMIYAATQVTVNTTSDANIADTEMSLVEAVYYLNGLQDAPFATLGRALTPTEAAQVTTQGPEACESRKPRRRRSLFDAQLATQLADHQGAVVGGQRAVTAHVDMDPRP